MTIQRLGTTARYSDLVTHQNTLYTVEVPTTESGDIHTQTTGLLANLASVLKQGGSGKEHILMATVYLTDMADYDGMNAAWEAWLSPGTAPCRACLQVVRLAKPGWRVEIAVTAACPA